MYRLWKQDPNSVHPSWSVYFSGMARGLKSEDAFRPPPNLLDLAEMSTEGSAELPITSQGSDVQDHMKVCVFTLSTLSLSISLSARETAWMDGFTDGLAGGTSHDGDAAGRQLEARAQIIGGNSRATTRITARY